MNDLISRRAAMIVIENSGLDDDSKDTVVRVLETLPSAQPEIVRCHKCIHWDRDTVRQNSNDAGWWNEAVCEKYSDEIWTAWKDADWYCADAERRTDERSD